MKLLLLNTTCMTMPHPPLEIRRCRPERGWFWLRDAYTLFRKSPLVFISIYGILFLTTVVLPGIFAAYSYGWGAIIVSLFMTFVVGAVFNGGIVYAYQLADQDEDPEIEHLFIGFRHRFYELLVLGLILCVGLFVAVFFAVFAAVITLLPFAIAVVNAGHAADYTEKGPVILVGLAMLYALPVFLVAFVALWFGPSLVLLRNVKPWDAIRESILGGWRNTRPLTVFSLLWLLFLFPFAALSYSLLGVSGGLLFGVGIVIFGGALYTSYKEIFPQDTLIEPRVNE